MQFAFSTSREAEYQQKKWDIGSRSVGNFQGDRGLRAKVCRPRHYGLFHRQRRQGWLGVSPLLSLQFQIKFTGH